MPSEQKPIRNARIDAIQYRRRFYVYWNVLYILLGLFCAGAGILLLVARVLADGTSGLYRDSGTLAIAAALVVFGVLRTMYAASNLRRFKSSPSRVYRDLK